MLLREPAFVTQPRAPVDASVNVQVLPRSQCESRKPSRFALSPGPSSGAVQTRPRVDASQTRARIDREPRQLYYTARASLQPSSDRLCRRLGGHSDYSAVSDRQVEPVLASCTARARCPTTRRTPGSSTWSSCRRPRGARNASVILIGSGSAKASPGPRQRLGQSGFAHRAPPYASPASPRAVPQE